jgi:hypothetical protein
VEPMLDIKDMKDLLVDLTEMGKLTWEETGEKINKYERTLKGRKTFFNGIEIKISLKTAEKKGWLGSSSTVNVGGLIFSDDKEEITLTTDKQFLCGEEVESHYVFYLAYEIQRIIERKGLEKRLMQELSLMFHT